MPTHIRAWAVWNNFRSVTSGRGDYPVPLWQRNSIDKCSTRHYTAFSGIAFWGWTCSKGRYSTAYHTKAYAAKVNEYRKRGV